MEKFEELSESSKRRIKIADHMLTQTFPLVKDPKLLIAVMENTFLALTYSIGALLHYERQFKRVPPFSDNFESKFEIFKEKLTDKYKINKNHLTLIRDIKDIIIEHRKSPVEFTRNDRFIICGENYRMKTISLDQMKKYVRDSKAFVSQISAVLDSMK